MNAYPAISDYFRAVQAPGRAFTVASLQTAEFAWDGLGPALATGSSAVVFHATVAGQPSAIRCFTRSETDGRTRYQVLDGYLEHHNLLPHVSKVTWLDAAIQVNGGAWPVLQMEWIDGRRLDVYVDHLVTTGNLPALAELATRWRKMVCLLQDSEFAHGDFQHGNVLIDQAGLLRLVDFDEVFVPGLAGLPAPTEYGHPNYQHPDRTAANGWGRWADSFSALVIYLSLIALSKSPRMWGEFYTSENLLFVKSDFAPPFRTPIWERLAAVNDHEVDRLAGLLQKCCQPSWTARESLRLMLDALVIVRQWWDKPPQANGAPPSDARSETTSPLPPPPSNPPPWTPPRGSFPPPPGPPGGSGQAWRSDGTGTIWWQDSRQVPPPGQAGGHRQPPPPPPPPPTRPAGRGVRRRAALAWAVVLAAIAIFVLAKTGAFNGSTVTSSVAPTIATPVNLAGVFPDIADSTKASCSAIPPGSSNVVQTVKCNYPAAPNVVVYYHQFVSADIAQAFVTNAGPVGKWSKQNSNVQEGPIYHGGYSTSQGQGATDRGAYTDLPYAFEVNSWDQAAADNAFQKVINLQALN